MAGDLFAFTIVGLITGAAYAIAASGLVVTYATSNVFNMAHGAVGMVMAFLYWELSVNQGLPEVVALVLVVGVIAPLFGAMLERTMMRKLTNASVSVALVVTVGLLVLLIGFAQTVWPPGARSVAKFFPNSSVGIASVTVSAHQLITFGLAAVVAAGLWYFLSRTQTGVAMRAVVDNRTLVALHGAYPERLAMYSWAIGSSLAALAGILLVADIGLDYATLTLLVINAYAAALVGRLKSLPATFVGALALGIAQSYFLFGLRWLPDGFDDGGLINGLRSALPTLFLFAVMLYLPQEKLRVGAVTGTRLPRLPSHRRVLVSGVGFVAAVVVLVNVLSTSNVSRFGQALVISAIMLSLVVLTGYGGVISLSQMTFVGVGALIVARTFGGELSVVSVATAAIVSGIVGAIVALPALRLKGLYLGLGTLAFAVAMDKMIFESRLLGFNLGGSKLIERPTILGISLEGERAFTVFVAIMFVLMAVVVLQIRRGRFGRFLLAIRDSHAACGTLGLAITRTRVMVFAMSAALAGVAGALYGGMRIAVGPIDFVMFNSLPILLLVVVFGVTSVSGALLGGLTLGLLPILQEQFPALGGIVFLLVGAAAVGLGNNPNGVVSLLFDRARRIAGREAEPAAFVPGTVEERVLNIPDELPEEVSLVGAS